MAGLRKTITVFIKNDELKMMNAKKNEGVPMTVFYRELVREGWRHKEELKFDEKYVLKKDGVWAHINFFLPLDEAREHDELRTKGTGYRGKMPMTTFYLQLLKIGWRHKFETSKPSP